MEEATSEPEFREGVEASRHLDRMRGRACHTHVQTMVDRFITADSLLRFTVCQALGCTGDCNSVPSGSKNLVSERHKSVIITPNGITVVEMSWSMKGIQASWQIEFRGN